MKRSMSAVFACVAVGAVVLGVLASAARATAPGVAGDIVFQRYLEPDNGRGSIFTMRPNGTGERQVTASPPGMTDRFPDFGAAQRAHRLSALRRVLPSDDGQGRRHGSAPSHEDVRAGSDPSRLHRELVPRLLAERQPHRLRAPVRSPRRGDGAARPRRDLGHGPERHRASPGDATAVAWELDAGDGPDISPDGKRVLFRFPEHNGFEGSDTATMNLDGTGFRQLTDTAPTERVLSAPYSPDGRHITLARDGIAGLPDVWTMQTNGRDLRRVTFNALWDSGPDWGAR